MEWVGEAWVVFFVFKLQLFINSIEVIRQHELIAVIVILKIRRSCAMCCGFLLLDDLVNNLQGGRE